MGSWRETCAITQLPIQYGDSTVAFLLTKVHDLNLNTSAGFCHANTFWSPRSIQIYGTYNDYGTINVAEDWSTTFIINCFRRDGIIDIEDNDILNTISTFNEATFKDVQDLIHHGKLSIKTQFNLGNTPKTAPIGIMFVHRFIFDEMMQMCFTPRFREVNLDSYRTSARSWLQQIYNEQHDSEYTNMDVQLKMRDISQSQECFSSIAHADDIHVAYQGIRYYLHNLYNNFFDGKDVDLLIEELSRFCMFNDLLEVLRKHYSPQNGKGSQDADFDVTLHLMKTAIEYTEGKINNDQW